MAPLALILGGLVLLIVGAEALVRGASALALKLGLSTLVVGLTVVAFGTSAPELVVSVQAAREAAGGIALGNVIGSNIANIALILGLSALLRPLRVETQLVRLDLPLLIGVSLVLVLLLLDRALGRVEGAVLSLGLLGYVALTLRVARREEPAGLGEALPTAQGSAWRHVLFVGAGLAMLATGAGWLVDGAVAVAEAAGVPPAVVGLTLVAVGTSLPELATSAVATYRGAGDVAIGNVVGSNLFNVLGILGAAALVHPLAAPSLTLVDLAVMFGLAIVLLPLARSGFALTRWEGALLVGVYVGYTVYLLA